MTGTRTREVRTSWAEISELFVGAVKSTCEQMAGMQTQFQRMYETTDYHLHGDVSAVIGLTADREGACVLSVSDATARAIAGRVLAGMEDSLDEGLIRDCIGELANIICGQAKGLLADTSFHFSFSTPTVVAGPQHEIRHRPGMPCVVMELASDVGTVVLMLCLQA